MHSRSRSRFQATTGPRASGSFQDGRCRRGLCMHLEREPTFKSLTRSHSADREICASAQNTTQISFHELMTIMRPNHRSTEYCTLSYALSTKEMHDDHGSSRLQHLHTKGRNLASGANTPKENRRNLATCDTHIAAKPSVGSRLLSRRLSGHPQSIQISRQHV